MVLSQEALEKIISMAPEENDHWDFKLQWYKKNNRNNLLLDIINMVNTPHHDDCYIIIGIDDDTGDIVGVKSNTGRMNRQNLQDFLRNKPFAQNFYPLTDVKRYTVYSPTEGKNVKIDVITIFNENNVPIYLNEDLEGEPILDKNRKFVRNEDGTKKRKQKIKQGLIYSRINDSNTPIDSSTNDAQMELLWKKRLGLDLNIFDRFKHCLKETNNWFYTETEDRPKYIYQMNPDFVVEEAKDKREEYRAHFVSWTQTLMNVRVDYRCIQLKYRGIVIKEYVATVMDGGRFIACDPKTGNIGNDNFFYYYVKDSLRYLVNEMIKCISFPNKATHNWEGYDQIKKNLVVFENSTELSILKENKNLQDELNQKYTPSDGDITKLSRKINNNRESDDKLWNDSKIIAEQFLIEKHNAMVVNQHLKSNSKLG